MGLPGYLPGCFPVLPGWGVRCSRSYREGGQRTSLPTGPATAAKPGRAKRRAHSSGRRWVETVLVVRCKWPATRAMTPHGP